MLRQYIEGWRVFWQMYAHQRRKKHGTGPAPVIRALRMASCGRWLVDGQHRNAWHHMHLVLWWQRRRLALQDREGEG